MLPVETKKAWDLAVSSQVLIFSLHPLFVETQQIEPEHHLSRD